MGGCGGVGVMVHSWVPGLSSPGSSCEGTVGASAVVSPAGAAVSSSVSALGVSSAVLSSNVKLFHIVITDSNYDLLFLHPLQWR